MKTAWIVSVGDEVLHGQTLNTNSSFLAKELGKAGVEIIKTVVVGDDWEMIQKEVHQFQLSSADFLITTGGLGPTHDDFTKEAICDYLGLELVLHDEAEQLLKSYFGEHIAKSNYKQMYFPKNALLLSNTRGTADGAIFTHQDKTYILLVGPPYEMHPMYYHGVVPYLQGAMFEPLIVKEYMVVGLGESVLEDLLQEVYQKNPYISIAPYASLGRIRYQIIGKEKEQDLFYQAVSDFEEILAEYIVSDEGKEVDEVVFSLLREKNYWISFAESCTGGALVSTLVRNSGASSILKESYVTYSIEAKQNLLGVKNETIEAYGVVSAEVVGEMVQGLHQKTGADVCVAVSGVLGPTPIEQEDTPIGLVYYGIKVRDQVFIEQKKFRGDREMVQTRAVIWIYYRLYQLLKKIQ